ncbi:MAG: efflux RND transporter permease subunit [Chloroflexota bacterium]|nr:efflux RND transporter permease subunit [Chloroflexota bacterium]
MGLTRLAINRPLAILMLLVSLVLMGAVSYTRMKVDRFPAISFPAVFVSVQYAGASPTDVEELLAKPIENAVSELPGIDTMSSTSSEGSLSLNVRFVEGTDTNQAALDVERRIASVRNRLPADIGAVNVTKADVNQLPIMNIALSGDRSLAELYDVGNDVILPRLQSVPGVADVTLAGGLRREFQVKVDSARLRAYGISLQQIETALQRENVSSPSWRLSEGASSQSVRALAPYKSADDLRSLIVVNNPRVIRLQDLATVVDTYAEQTRLQRFNGKDAVGFIVTKQADANSI